MRYLPLTDEDRRAMLATIGVGRIEELYRGVPKAALLDAPVDLPNHAGEIEVERRIRAFAARNLGAASAPFFLGAGNYFHHVPASVDHLIQRSEYLTSYTPYQPEISQGTLQALFEFQTQVALITGMEIANASMYDGATACAEAALMACRVTRRNRVVLSGGLHPHYRDVTATGARFMNLDIVALPADAQGTEDAAVAINADTACVIVQNPDMFGRVRDHSALADACHAKGALLVVVVNEIVSLGAVMSPGDMGADIVAAEGQSLGNPMSFGGPHVGLFAVREKFLRQMPGRLCGETVDADGKRGWVLTLSTREQHIRREKATSNICTNSGLCALAFTIHLTLLGEAGFTRLAEVNHANASRLAKKLGGLKGVELLNDTFFNEFTLHLPRSATDVVEALAKRNILAGVPGGRLFPKERDLTNLLLVTATEMTTDEDMDRLANGLAEVLK
jgi:glycine dehydrogenase subunit 1